MKELFKDYLFDHHILVYDLQYPIRRDIHFNTLISLANQFGIIITKGYDLANVQMIHDAERNLGIDVPEPFYRGFPGTVRQYTPDQLLYDQLYHYSRTYGLGWFDEAGHSVLELTPGYSETVGRFESVMIPEKVEPKKFIILDEEHAKLELFKLLKGLCQSSRPLNLDQETIVWEGFNEYGSCFMPNGFSCKDTAIKFLYKTKNLAFAKSLRLSDVIKLVEYIQFNEYGSTDINKLNLRNKDRKLITSLIDNLLDPNKVGAVDIRDCFEKRKTWCGLLHHLHYKPKNRESITFVKKIRESKMNLSYMSTFECYMSAGDTVSAAKYLCEKKGSSALLRNLNYILSRCNTENQVKEVLECLE